MSGIPGARINNNSPIKRTKEQIAAGKKLTNLLLEVKQLMPDSLLVCYLSLPETARKLFCNGNEELKSLYRQYEEAISKIIVPEEKSRLYSIEYKKEHKKG